MKLGYTGLTLFPLASLALMSCSDDVTNITQYYQSSAFVLESGVELSDVVCDSAAVGKMLYAGDSNRVYLCNGEEWSSMTQLGQSGDSETEKGCHIVGDSAGVVTLKCGSGKNADSAVFYKAVCGKTPYDPAESFCVNDEVYDPDEYFVDSRDNHVYRYISVGKKSTAQVWMAENLNYEVNNGSQSWCFDNDDENCSEYGRLYTWAAAVGKTEADCGYDNECGIKMPFRGICPAGWHMPSDVEWNTLLKNSKEEKKSGTMLMSKNGWNGSKGNDNLDFTALPAGFLNEGIFEELGTSSFFWTALEVNAAKALAYALSVKETRALSKEKDKDLGFSIRCIRD